jgi:hypothetical protein
MMQQPNDKKQQRRQATRNKSTKVPLRVELLESRDLPAPLTWFAGPSLPAARGGAVAAADQGAAFTFLGGGPSDVLTVEPADPAWAASVWSDPSFGDRTSVSPGIGVLGTASLLVFGGNQGGAVADAVQYDSATGAQEVASMHTPRELLGSATDQQGKVYAIGGIDDNGTPLASVEYYTQSTNTWTFTASLPQTLYAESAAYDGNGHIFTFGGVGAGGSILNTVYEYTIATNTWSVAAPMPGAVRDSAAVLASNNLIYVLGGKTSTGTTAAAESYNPATNTWNTEAPLPGPVSNEAVVSDSLGRIEILGGFDASGNALANVWVSQRLNAPDSVPTITSAAPTTAATIVPYSYQVTSTANPQATYSLTTAPSGMTINSATGLISWTPTPAQAGTAEVTVQASNYAGQGSQTYFITVKQSPPAAPTGVQVTGTDYSSISLSWNPSTGPFPISSYTVYHFYVTGHSGRGGGITDHWDPVGTTNGTTLTVTGLYAGTPYTYTIKATDTNGDTSSYSLYVTGTTLADTVPPTFTSVPANQTVVGANYGATDPNAFTATAVDNGPGIDGIASITYLVGPYAIYPGNYFQVGTTTVTVIASDWYGNTARASFTVTVLDSSPQLTLPANQLVEPQSSAGSTDPGAFSATAADGVDGISSITYAVGSAPINSSYVFPLGTTAVTVTATDDSGFSTSGTFNVTVQDIPPTLNINGLPAGNTVTEGTALNLTASGSAGSSAENAYGLTFNWSVTKVHNGVTTSNFASGTGSGSSVPVAFTADDDGTFTLSVTATDVNGAATTVTDTLTATTVAPTTGLSGPGDAVPYQDRLFTLTAASPSPVDQASPFSFAINWGDGSTQTVTADSGTVVGHTYTGTGTFPVSVTATDKDGVAGNSVTQDVAVKSAQQENDPATQGGSVGLAIGGTSGNDNIQITTGAVSGTVTVTLDGTNLGTFTPQGNSLIVFGAPGTNTVIFKAPSGAGTYRLTGATLAYSNSGTGIPLFNLTLGLTPAVAKLVVQGGNAGSSYTIQDATVAATLNAGAGSDTFTFADTGAATGAVTVNGGGGTNSLIGSNLSNSWNLTGAGAGTLHGGTEPADTFTGIQNLTGGSGADTFHFATNTAYIAGTIDGKGGANILDYSGRTTAVTVTLASGGPNKGSGIGGTWTNVQTLLGSQATTDTLVGPNATTTWMITGSNSGTVAGVAFSSIENLTGGSGNDTFVFSGNGNVTGPVKGGGGTNTIDVSGYTSASTVNLQTRTATPIGGTFGSITSFVGDNNTSTLIGPNTATTWSITATNKGTAGLTSFSGFVNLTGGTGNDTFKLSNGVGVTGTIDGGTGANTLDYSAYTTGIIVDLLIPTATNIGAINNIQNVNSGTGNSILVGNGGSNNFRVKGGHNVVIGGGGSYKLTGGTGQDILIAGTTSFDSNVAALDAILAYWGRTDLTYAQEVSGLATVGVTYQDSSGTQTAVLNTSTVFDNGVVDTLAGGSGLDWFFAHRTGTNQDVITGNRNGEVITDI